MQLAFHDVMTEQPPLLPTLSEAQRAQALERFVILRPALEEGVPQTQIARTYHLPLSTVQRWIKRYREHGLIGLARQQRSDRGKPRGMPSKLVQLIDSSPDDRGREAKRLEATEL